ncbi:hypothetical protein E4U31_005572 [Claviceps sp. LM219 group G6]|nr:hypothetical protein E4U31_005572 [Claviceps sp. LM219 group G6]
MTPAGAGSCVRSSSQGRREMEGGAACNGDVAFLDPSSTSLTQSLTVWYQVWCHEAEAAAGMSLKKLLVDLPSVEDISSMMTADRLEF